MSEIFELLGALCLAAFVFFIWPPLVLLVLGVFLTIVGVAVDGVKFRRKDGRQ